MSRIETGEAKIAAASRSAEILSNKVSSIDYPLQQLAIPYGPTQRNKSYTEEEDRFLLVKANKIGLDSADVYDRLKRELLVFPAFRFDWFFKSRTPDELKRRLHTLLGMLTKEADERQAALANGTKKKGGAANAPATLNGAKGKAKATSIASTSRSKVCEYLSMYQRALMGRLEENDRRGRGRCVE